MTVTATLTNTAARRYSLDALTITLPLPAHADELLRFDGRWAREFQPVRSPWTAGSVLSENQRGRTSHERVPLLFAGTHGFGEWSGEVWGVHVAWSANHTMFAERLADGRRYVQGGELLHPGEIVLEPGESYSTPLVVAVYSDGGLTPATWGFHRLVRSGPAHPTTPRPVLLNTWEAVYFNHDTQRLCELADVAASVGVERFVLDDGWFGSRRDDTSGLGDWWVSPDVYPDGLAPLVDHVTGLGMEFGIWVEPEMVNPDSELLPRPSRVGAGDRRLRAGARSQSARARPRSSRGVRAHPRLARCAASRSRHLLRQVGHEPRPRAGVGLGRRRRHASPDGGAVCAARRVAGAASDGRDSSRVRVAAVVSTSRSCDEPSGCGRATATMRSNVRRSSVVPRC